MFVSCEFLQQKYSLLANLPVCFFEIIQSSFLYPSLQEDNTKSLIQAYLYVFILAVIVIEYSRKYSI